MRFEPLKDEILENNPKTDQVNFPCQYPPQERFFFFFLNVPSRAICWSIKIEDLTFRSKFIAPRS